MLKYILTLISVVITLQGSWAQKNAELQALSKSFFEWRAAQQPASGDDIPRVERPIGWAPNYTPAALKTYQQDYTRFKGRLKNLNTKAFTLADSVDYLLMHSAIERVHWEMNVLKLPYRNPDFYVHQTLGTVFELLIIHTPITDQRIQEIIKRFESFENTLQAARVNLTDPFQGGAKVAIANLDNIGSKLEQVRTALLPQVKSTFHTPLTKAIKQATLSLESYRGWLESRVSTMNPKFEVGRDAYVYFLKNIALMPYSPEELLLIGQREWTRSVAFDVMEELRNTGLPANPLFKNSDEQIAKEKLEELAMREFLEKQNIMTVPADVKHYLNKKLPPHVEPLRFLGVTDDLTSATRLNEDGVSYIPEPSTNNPFFYRAIAQDPRTLITHEGVPGHYFQLVRSWKNDDPIRRHYFDSGSNEGIGFYVEELLLQMGLFNDKPRTREIMYKWMRLRALRVEVDISLALGRFDREQAAKYLETTVPMDEATAREEADMFTLTPGQAISYQIGKSQIIDFLSEAKLKQGNQFSLRHFHDYLMVNGNVPISLLKAEYLKNGKQLKGIWPTEMGAATLQPAR